MNTKTRRPVFTLVATALMIALTFVLGITPLGFLRLPFIGIDITTLCLPVIIGTVMLGWLPGLLIALVFAVTSTITALTAPSPLLAPLLNFPWVLYPCIFLPRLVIPLTTWGMYKLTAKLPKAVGLGITAATGSLTNTVLFLGMVFALGAQPVAESFGMTEGAVGSALALIVATNGLPEMAFAVLICVPVILALKRIIKE